MTDYLPRLLHQQELTPGMMAIALGVAFLLGAAHALTPGHGKTIVAAYLVGSRGTLKHAVFLGAMVTFTHTVSVFLLGLATLFLFHYVVPQNVIQVLGAVSGLSIVAIGGWMLFTRLRHEQQHRHGHHHHHHDHDHHHHLPDEVSWSGLVALGASGGLVPCESALVLLLSAIALRRAGLGLVLLVAFSLGLALVLMGIGVVVIYAKNLVGARVGTTAQNPFFRWIPVASATVVLIIGLLMTGVWLIGIQRTI
jgi:nickel/cobalt transporter (NicO) family protein